MEHAVFHSVCQVQLSSGQTEFVKPQQLCMFINQQKNTIVLNLIPRLCGSFQHFHAHPHLALVKTYLINTLVRY